MERQVSGSGQRRPGYGRVGPGARFASLLVHPRRGAFRLSARTALRGLRAGRPHAGARENMRVDQHSAGARRVGPQTGRFRFGRPGRGPGGWQGPGSERFFRRQVGGPDRASSENGKPQRRRGNPPRLSGRSRWTCARRGADQYLQGGFRAEQASRGGGQKAPRFDASRSVP
ncbi:hypothetical protein QKG26_gp039 [Chelonid alphaherpesvirus 5]|uniref:Uncharacterized protein n=1 Tax=Chelonid alphaherpesvirus 5 TaxID=702736 RepID=V5NWH6_9ALPH|nr:hypothetical protein QKG26_gp039 [Chelonid alphaherpesvirus 5]AHA93326.1 hypothetical protein [Chelonid alphaherpesvirus 5]